jgi:hypothetical protein
MPQLQQSAVPNRLLASLSADDFALLQLHLERVTIEGAGPLFRADFAMERSPTMRALFLRFVHTFIVQDSQTAYANAGYSLEERLARWLVRSSIDLISL